MHKDGTSETRSKYKEKMVNYTKGIKYLLYQFYQVSWKQVALQNYINGNQTKRLI